MSIYDPAVIESDFIPLDSSGKPMSGEALAAYQRLKHAQPSPMIPQTFASPSLSGPPPAHLAFISGPGSSSPHSLQLASADLSLLPKLGGFAPDELAGTIPQPTVLSYDGPVGTLLAFDIPASVDSIVGSPDASV